jgi:hypothetical protein
MAKHFHFRNSAVKLGRILPFFCVPKGVSSSNKGDTWLDHPGEPAIIGCWKRLLRDLNAGSRALGRIGIDVEPGNNWSA